MNELLRKNEFQSSFSLYIYFVSVEKI